MGAKKSLQEAAAEILKKSVETGHADPMQKLPGSEVEDLGGEDGTKANVQPDTDATKKISKVAPRKADKSSPQDPRKGLTKVDEAEEKDDDEDDKDSGGDDDSSGGDDEDDKKDESVVTELSKKTLGSYIKKASSEAGARKRIAGSEKQRLQHGNSKFHDDKANKRLAGVSKATDKLTKEDTEIDFSVDLGNLFEGTDLSEDFKNKVSTIFEAAVESKFNQLAEQLTEAYEEALQEEIVQVVDQLTEQVDGYMSQIAEAYMEENKLALEVSLRTELAEDFINGLHHLFVEHYINVPDERLDVYQDLTAKVDSMQEQLNAALTQNLTLQEALAHERKWNLIAQRVDESSMTDAQASKFRDLAEDLEYKSEADFNKKLDTVIENYFTKKSVDNPVKLDEDLNNGSSKVVETSAHMSRYADTLSRMTKGY